MSQFKHGEHDLATFNWEDPFLLEPQLTDDERMLRDGRAPSRKVDCNRGS